MARRRSASEPPQEPPIGSAVSFAAPAAQKQTLADQYKPEILEQQLLALQERGENIGTLNTLTPDELEQYQNDLVAFRRRLQLAMKRKPIAKDELMNEENPFDDDDQIADNNPFADDNNKLATDIQPALEVLEEILSQHQKLSKRIMRRIAPSRVVKQKAEALQAQQKLADRPKVEARAQALLAEKAIIAANLQEIRKERDKKYIDPYKVAVGANVTGVARDDVAYSAYRDAEDIPYLTNKKIEELAEEQQKYDLRKAELKMLQDKFLKEGHSAESAAELAAEMLKGTAQDAAVIAKTSVFAIVATGVKVVATFFIWPAVAIYELARFTCYAAEGICRKLGAYAYASDKIRDDGLPKFRVMKDENGKLFRPKDMNYVKTAFTHFFGRGLFIPYLIYQIMRPAKIFFARLKTALDDVVEKPSFTTAIVAAMIATAITLAYVGIIVGTLGIGSLVPTFIAAACGVVGLYQAANTIRKKWNKIQKLELTPNETKNLLAYQRQHQRQLDSANLENLSEIPAFKAGNEVEQLKASKSPIVRKVRLNAFIKDLKQDAIRSTASSIVNYLAIWLVIKPQLFGIAVGETINNVAKWFGNLFSGNKATKYVPIHESMDAARQLMQPARSVEYTIQNSPHARSALQAQQPEQQLQQEFAQQPMVVKRQRSQEQDRAAALARAQASRARSSSAVAPSGRAAATSPSPGGRVAAAGVGRNSRAAASASRAAESASQQARRPADAAASRARRAGAGALKAAADSRGGGTGPGRSSGGRLDRKKTGKDAR